VSTIIEPGVYDLPEDEYHADPLRHAGGSLSSTVARKLLPPSVPALAKHAADHPQHTDAQDWGTVVHHLILGSGPRIVEIPSDSWATKAAKEARAAAEVDGAIALLTKQLDAARDAADAVHAHATARALLARPGRPERTLAWQEGDTWCRAMLDRWPDPDQPGGPIAVDVKTTAKGLDDHSLAKTMWEYGYHCQAEWYSRGYHAVHGIWPAFVFLFVHSKPPHLVRCIDLPDELLVDARARNDEALQVWRECRRTGVWPGFATGITTISAPRWADLREDTYA